LEREPSRRRDIATPAIPRQPGLPWPERPVTAAGAIAKMPPTIRLHGMHGPYGRHPSGERRPQMISLVEHVERGPVGVSRTFLAIDGSQKATLDPVRLFRGPVGGGAVRLAPAADTVVVAEGLETALAVMAATALPAWAALSAGGIEALVLPPIVRQVIIAADHDRNGRGERAARIAADRWLAEARLVRIAMSPEVETDFNDVLIGRTYARIAETSYVAA
jgi:putative DNA primase/helicase